jgi:hypothetical protein
MYPIYFPYTYINRPMAVMLKECLGPVSVYQPSERQVPEPMQLLAQEGFIELRAPVVGDEKQLGRLLDDYRDWAALRRPARGIDTAYLRTLKDRLPFFEDDSTSRIRAQIKQQMGGRPAVAGDVDAAEILFRARLFLQLAQEFDLQSEGIAADLARCNEMERELLKDLHGETGTGEAPSAAKESPTGSETTYFMLTERIESWATLMLADPHQAGPSASGLFVTGNREVVELMAERLPEIQQVVDLDIGHILDRSSPAGLEAGRALQAQIAALPAADFSAGVPTVARMFENLPPAGALDAEDAGAAKPAMQIHAFPEKPPAAVFSALAPRATPVEPDKTQESPLRNTVIILVG